MRKNRIAALAVAGLMLMTTPVYALDIDLDSLTIEELVELRNTVSETLQERLGGEDVFGAGTYIVGRDIRPGNYLFTNTDENWSGFYIFQPDEEFTGNRWDSDYATELSNVGDTATFNFIEGQTIIVLGSGTLQEIKPSWVP